ncbi:neuronal acetylcholine receptor subunit alpha-7-like [Haliotis rubra]|uniref:neuronal acetylcholine receptor subunit alpha-7-like n=1 Tax=Haliotis rubra TaxID=36100 RepID=UPI001EE51CF5|nr:neuronal acetylcholine receptor subunit alpha-7-like [Haliotis rubra]
MVTTTSADTMDIQSRLSKEKMTDYILTVPPIINGTTLNITIDFNLGTLVDLNEKDQSLTLDGWLDVDWTDPRLAWSVSEYNTTEVCFKQKQTWLPSLVITNTLKERKVMGYDDLLLYVSHDGHVTWYPGDIYKTRCMVDVTSFPFDYQTCTISVGLWLSNDKVRLQVSPDRSEEITSDKPNSEWEIVKLSKHVRNDEVEIVINMRRYPSYYVLNLLLPVMFISSLIPFAFALPMEKGDRVSFTMSVVLSLVVFLTLLGDTLPKTSLQISILSIYITTLLGISVLSVVMVILILKISAISDSRPIPAWIRRTTCLNERKLRQVKKRVVPAHTHHPTARFSDPSQLSIAQRG